MTEKEDEQEPAHKTLATAALIIIELEPRNIKQPIT